MTKIPRLLDEKNFFYIFGSPIWTDASIACKIDPENNSIADTLNNFGKLYHFFLDKNKNAHIFYNEFSKFET